MFKKARGIKAAKNLRKRNDDSDENQNLHEEEKQENQEVQPQFVEKDENNEADNVDEKVDGIPDISAISLARRQRAQKRGNLFSNVSTGRTPFLAKDDYMSFDHQEIGDLDNALVVLEGDDVEPQKMQVSDDEKGLGQEAEAEEEDMEWEESQIRKALGDKVAEQTIVPMRSSLMRRQKDLKTLKENFLSTLSELETRLEYTKAELKAVSESAESEAKLSLALSSEREVLVSDLDYLQSFEGFVINLCDMIQEKSLQLEDLKQRQINTFETVEMLKVDINEEFGSVNSIVEKFMEFKGKQPHRYEQSYANLSIADLCDFHIKLELLGWNPFTKEDNKGTLDSMNWMQVFINLVLDNPSDDFGGDLIKALVLKYVCPMFVEIVSVLPSQMDAGMVKRFLDIRSDISDYIGDQDLHEFDLKLLDQSHLLSKIRTQDYHLLPSNYTK